MNVSKSIRKRLNCITHRDMVYEKALDGVINGTTDPEYAYRRWQKLKAAKGGKVK